MFWREARVVESVYENANRPGPTRPGPTGHFGHPTSPMENCRFGAPPWATSPVVCSAAQAWRLVALPRRGSPHGPFSIGEGVFWGAGGGPRTASPGPPQASDRCPGRRVIAPGVGSLSRAGFQNFEFAFFVFESKTRDANPAPELSSLCCVRFGTRPSSLDKYEKFKVLCFCALLEGTPRTSRAPPGPKAKDSFLVKIQDPFSGEKRIHLLGENQFWREARVVESVFENANRPGPTRPGPTGHFGHPASPMENCRFQAVVFGWCWSVLGLHRGRLASRRVPSRRVPTRRQCF